MNPVRRVRWIGSAFVVIAAVFVASSCSSASRPTTSATTTTRPAPAPVAPASFAALAREIITRMPPGFDVQPDTGDMGPSDLAKVSDNKPSARKALLELGFVRRYARLWIGPRHAQIFVWIDQFQARAGPASDYERRAGDNRARPVPGSHPFVVAGIPRGEAFGRTTRGAALGTAEAAIEFTTGVFEVEVVCNGPGSETTMAQRATSLAVAQFDRLAQ